MMNNSDTTSKQSPAAASVVASNSHNINVDDTSSIRSSSESSIGSSVKFNDTIEIHTIPRVNENDLEDLYYLESDIETFQYEVYQHAIEVQTAIQYGIPINDDDDELAGITGQFQSLLMR